MRKEKKTLEVEPKCHHLLRRHMFYVGSQTKAGARQVAAFREGSDGRSGCAVLKPLLVSKACYLTYCQATAPRGPSTAV